MNKGNNGHIQEAMKNGTILGCLWIVAFATYIVALTTPGLSLIFIALLIASPIYAGYLGIRYRRKDRENKLGFMEAWSFMIIMYLCASILSAIACYVYFQYMDNGTLLAAFKEQIDIYTSMDIGEEMKKAFNDTYDLLVKMNASDYCMQYLTTNIFITTFLAPLTAIFVYKKDKE